MLCVNDGQRFRELLSAHHSARNESLRQLTALTWPSPLPCATAVAGVRNGADAPAQKDTGGVGHAAGRGRLRDLGQGGRPPAETRRFDMARVRRRPEEVRKNGSLRDLQLAAALQRLAQTLTTHQIADHTFRQ